jgi:hypothetical protein
MAAPADDFRQRGRYSVSSDRQWRDRGRYRGQSLIWDECGNRYVTDRTGEVVTFPTPHDAERWLERKWAKAHGIDTEGSA